ncbi:MAG: hypothetical protein KKA63_10785 [Gammaproteobacteria bacterium]|nr:hypothetical protein [Gammaproteobacteria bacterium]
MKKTKSIPDGQAVGTPGINNHVVDNRFKKIRRIKQRKQSDCGVACVAMTAGVTYQEAFKAFNFSKGKSSFFTTRKQLENALNKLGCRVTKLPFKSWAEIPGRAILPVNRGGGGSYYHWIVFDGKDVIDPNPLKPPRQDAFDRYRSSCNYLLVKAAKIKPSPSTEGDAA